MKDYKLSELKEICINNNNCKLCPICEWCDKLDCRIPFCDLDIDECKKETKNENTRKQ